MKLIPTILCGGAGSRLWPVSRELHPKLFICLADGQSLLQKAWLRGAMLSHLVETLTVTNRELFFKIEDEYREVAATVCSGDIYFHVSNDAQTIKRVLQHYQAQAPIIDRTNGVSEEFPEWRFNMRVSTTGHCCD